MQCTRRASVIQIAMYSRRVPKKYKKIYHKIINPIKYTSVEHSYTRQQLYNLPK